MTVKYSFIGFHGVRKSADFNVKGQNYFKLFQDSNISKSKSIFSDTDDFNSKILPWKKFIPLLNHIVNFFCVGWRLSERGTLAVDCQLLHFVLYCISTLMTVIFHNLIIIFKKHP